MNSKKFTTNSGLPVKLLAQLCLLRRDTDRARVEVADAHHDAAPARRRAVPAPNSSAPSSAADDDVAAGLQLSVDLDDDAVAACRSA